MSLLALPWSIMFLPIVILFILFLRELLIAVRIPSLHPEWKMAVFNGILLFFFIIAGLIGIEILRERDRQFTELFPRYPNSRYAPERELFREDSAHVYVTLDEPATVVSFYNNRAKTGEYRVTLDDRVNQSGRLLLESSGTKLFLTAIEEQGVTVLYFSPQGEMITITK